MPEGEGGDCGEVPAALISDSEPLREEVPGHVVGTEPGLERGEGDKWRGEPQRGTEEESP